MTSLVSCFLFSTVRYDDQLYRRRNNIIRLPVWDTAGQLGVERLSEGIPAYQTGMPLLLQELKVVVGGVALAHSVLSTSNAGL